MKIFFIGSVRFSHEMLKVLLLVDSIEIVGLATKSMSNFNSDHSDLSELAMLNGIEYKFVKDINAEHITNWIKGLNPDLIFCLGWSSLIKRTLLDIPPLGVIGYHPAELPMNRGRHPIIWALVLGLSRTASTFFMMDDGPDSGDIISQEIIKIGFHDTAGDLYQKLITKAKIQIIEIINSIQRNNLVLIPQKREDGNEWRKRSKSDGRIDWRMRSIDIYNLVRALDKPYPGAHFDFQGSEVKVWKCEIVENINSINFEPGKVLNVDREIVTVKTGDGAINLINHELPQAYIRQYLL